MSVTPRVEKIRQNYVNTKPSISYERARIWTESFKRTEGQPAAIRTAQAFYDTCNELCVNIFEGELIVGASGEFRKCGILTPEFAWKWVDDEMDNFPSRPQDPYEMTDEQRKFVRENIFPYWKGKSVEDAFLARTSEETKKIGVDTGFLDTDSKWRNGIGEISPDYIDQLFPKGFGGIKREAEEYMAELNEAIPEDKDKMVFYRSIILVSDGIVRLANRYSEKAKEMATEEKDEARKAELLEIAEVCVKVPENPPTSFREALQFAWFVQLGGIISENPLALNPGRFDQYMYPYYKADEEAGKIDYDTALELVECLWLKYSEWAWTISANTADFFAGYTNFENLTVGGSTVSGGDGTNTISYMAIQATKETKCHQPTLSCRIHPDCPPEFMEAVTDLVSTGCGFPAIHSDRTGYQMLSNLGYAPEDAKDWNNCGCVVPHSRKTFEWTSSCNISFAAALEFALNEGRSRLTGELVALPEKDPKTFESYEEIEAALLRQFSFMVKHGVISLLTAQKIHKEQAPRPFLSACNEYCLKNGKDLVDGGAKYNIGPVFTGVGLSVTANSLAVMKKLVFEDKVTTMAEIIDALNHNWEGYEELRAKAQAVPKYGNDDDYADDIMQEVFELYRSSITGRPNMKGGKYGVDMLPTTCHVYFGDVILATPNGRKAHKPVSEGISPEKSADTNGPTAVIKSCAKMDHLATAGTLLNQKFTPDVVAGEEGLDNMASLIRSYFSMDGHHIQFNVIDRQTLIDAQNNPEEYKDLIVRVAGYSDFFRNLSKPLQDEIIERTEQSFE